ncbi:NAD(P)-binding protein [Streptomyces sp. NPDC048659]|uniref:NAD(P)-binding protein n=1 Tax=Streptomyces sp. NPDC048659 TaxID=3155489 RepID=UPI00341BEAB4
MAPYLPLPHIFTLGDPAADLSDRIVLFGLGRIGTRVLAQLRTDHEVVAIDRDPAARSVAYAREQGVPVLEDATDPGVLHRARMRQSNSLLVLAREESRNLDVAMAAREANSPIRV